MVIELFLLLFPSVALSYFDYLEASFMGMQMFLSAIQFALAYVEYSKASLSLSLSFFICLALFSLSLSTYRQTDRQTDKQTDRPICP